MAVYGELKSWMTTLSSFLTSSRNDIRIFIKDVRTKKLITMDSGNITTT